MNAIAKFIATAGGAGYSPIAPGTCGTAVAVPLVWALAALPVWQFALITAAVTLIGIWAADRADRAWGTHDCQKIVIDEVAGYMVTMLLVDRAHWPGLACGFVAFRFFDIVKPPPVGWLDEHLPGGWGVVLDDIAAGVMGMVTMIALDHFGALRWLAGL
jgi:phosphatidylglycerophosphatase A